MNSLVPCTHSIPLQRYLHGWTVVLCCLRSVVKMLTSVAMCPSICISELGYCTFEVFLQAVWLLHAIAGSISSTGCNFTACACGLWVMSQQDGYVQCCGTPNPGCLHTSSISSIEKQSLWCAKLLSS